MELYPGVKISIGPAIEQGFYYDFEFPDGVTVSEADFPAIEERMRAHVKAAERFEREECPSPTRARASLAAGAGLQGRADRRPRRAPRPTPGGQGERAGHRLALHQRPLHRPLPRPARTDHEDRGGVQAAVGRRRLLAGGLHAHDAHPHLRHRVLLRRRHLEEHLERLEQARARDHRKLGRELDLFQFSELSPGAPLWKPAGMAVWNALTELWREENRARGYEEVKTPILYDVELFKQSGHWDKYRENMYFTEVECAPDGPEADELPGAHPDLQGRPPLLPRPADPLLRAGPRAPPRALRGAARAAARAPHHPGRRAHLLHRGAGAGGGRARACASAFTSTSCSASSRAWSSPRARSSGSAATRCGIAPRRRCDGALQAEGLAYEVNPGDGAFYGPKIDLHMTDSIGRSWQLGTVQLDYSMPERFELAYTGADNAEHRPVMIHRALLGSFERFIGILIEHYAGELPLWLAPVQAIVLPVSDRFNEYGASVRERLREQRPARRARRPRRVDRAQGPRRRAAPSPTTCSWSASARRREGTVSVRTRSGPGEHGDGRSAARRWTNSPSGWWHMCDGARPRPHPSSKRTHDLHIVGWWVHNWRAESDGRPEAPLARRRRAVILDRLERSASTQCAAPSNIGLTRRQDS